MKNSKSEFIEVELRVPENLSDKICEKYDLKLSSISQCKDTYIHFSPETGNLHRFRHMSNNGSDFFCESEKTACNGYFIETKRRITSEEYKRALYSPNIQIVGVVEGTRIKVPYNGLVFCLDDIKHLGEFTEFEINVQKESEN